MFANVAWVLVLLILLVLFGWLGYRSWKSTRWIKWPGSIFSGIIALLFLVVLVLGFLPTPLDRAPIPTQGHIGAPDQAPTTPVDAGVHHVWMVHPGESIQSAVDQAQPGDLVEVQPGVYQESILVHTGNLTLQGLPDAGGQWPVLDGQGQKANAVTDTADFFTIAGFQIRNYTGNGVVAQNAYGSAFLDLVITDPGQYGVFPALDTHVVIRRVKVTGARDAGIYVGQSRDILVADNEAYHNNSGIEIESSLDSTVRNNYVHDNTLGMLVWISPEKDEVARDGQNASLVNNRIENNNSVSIASEAFLQGLPPGIGILVLMADRTEIAQNTITGNHSAGVAIAAAPTVFSGTDKFTIPLVPQGNWLHDNQYSGNGAQPAGFITQGGFPGADILWDGSSWDSRFDDVHANTFPLLPSSAWPDLAKRALYQAYRFLISYLTGGGARMAPPV